MEKLWAPIAKHLGVILILGWSVCCPAPVFGQSYEKGVASYKRGQFKQSEEQLRLALDRTDRVKEKARILLLMGIIQYQKSRVSQAKKHFKEALSLHPKLLINRSLILDDTLIAYFRKLRRKFSKTSVKPTLVIKSKIPAKVSIDGILAGQVNEPIEIPAGHNKLSVRAPGYRAKKLMVHMGMEEQKTIRVSLERLPTKVRVKKKKRGPLPSRANGLFADQEPKFGKPKGKSSPSLVDEFNQELRSPEPTYHQRPNYPMAGTSVIETRDFYLIPKHQVTKVTRPLPPSPSLEEPSGIATPPPRAYFAPAKPHSRRQLLARSASEYDPDWTAALPFGVGQFQKGEDLFGLFIVAVEVGGLYLWYDGYTQAERVTRHSKKVGGTKEHVRLHEEKTQMSHLGLGLFVGTALFGAWDALNNPPPSHLRPRKRRSQFRKRRPRIYSSHHSIKPDLRVKEEAGELVPSLMVDWDYRF